FMLGSIIASILMLMSIACASAADIRRVVTGVDANDRSMAMSDSQVHFVEVQSGLNLGYLWVTDAFPVTPSKIDTKDKVISISPPENGTQFGVVEFQPADPASPTLPIWHRTRTVDYVVGEIDLMLEGSVGQEAASNQPARSVRATRRLSLHFCLQQIG